MVGEQREGIHLGETVSEKRKRVLGSGKSYHLERDYCK